MSALENGGKTGWPPGLLQDDCRALSRWFASRAGAYRQARIVAASIAASVLVGCGGVPVDASELEAFRAQLIADLRALELPEVRVDASELQALRDQLKADLERIEQRLRDIEAERAGRPAEPTQVQ